MFTPRVGRRRGVLSSCKFRVRWRSCRKARGLGIPEGDLRQSIDEQITASYRVNPQQAVFVECNMEDARRRGRTRGPGTPVPLLDDLQLSPSTATDDCAAVFTSLFHISEVSDLLDHARPGLSVVGVYTHPDERALGEIARIRPGSRVGIVCASSEGSRRFTNQIATFADVMTTTSCDPPALTSSSLPRAWNDRAALLALTGAEPWPGDPHHSRAIPCEPAIGGPGRRNARRSPGRSDGA